MRITSVTATAFGALTGQTLTFAPGLTVVWGPNESAKSTWHAAVYAALCGRRRGAARAEDRDFRDRHRPWDGDTWEVSARLELDDGRRVELHQDLDGKVDCRAIDLDLGTDLSSEIINDGTPDAARWLGLDRRSLRATAFVSQAQLLAVRGEAGSLQEHLQRAASTGGDETAAAALRRLASFREEQVGSDRAPTKPLRRAQTAVATAQAQLASAQLAHADYERRLAGLDDLLAAEALARATLEEEQARARDAAVSRRAVEAAALRSRLAAVQAARTEAVQRLEAARLEAARLEAARVEAARLEAARVEAARVEALRAEAERLAAAEAQRAAGSSAAPASAPPVARSRPRPWWVLGGAALVALGLALIIMKVALVGIPLVIAGVALIAAPALLPPAARPPASAPPISSARPPVDASRDLGVGATAEDRSVAPTPRSWDDPEVGATEEREMEAALAALAAALEEQVDPRAGAALETAVARRHAEEGALATLTATLPSVAEAEEAAEAARAELDRVERLDATLKLTMSFLQSAQERVHRDLAPVLAAALRSRLPAVTGGRYDDVIVDPAHLEVKVQASRGRWRDAALLSHGTAEQVYLLLRVALADQLVRPGVSCPLLLDDVTVHADPARTERLLDLLVDASRRHQVILFTQEAAVRDWAAAHPEATLSTLESLAAA